MIEKFDGTPLRFDNAQQLFEKMTSMKPGDTVMVTVMREGHEIDIPSVLTPRAMRHVFAVDPDATAEERELRRIWSRNL